MNYAEIKNLDIANGPGLRVSLFVSGCTHHCKGCFNPESWNFNYGQPFTEATQEHLLELLENEHIRGLSLLGGACQSGRTAAVPAQGKSTLSQEGYLVLQRL